MSLTPGTRLGPYEVVSPIGAGGMGEVYLAEDTRLNRRVAVKVLPPASADDPRARDRLLLEARAAAKLDHANICTVFDVGDADGLTYIAMQYLEGETLDRRLRRGRLDASSAVAVARQVADALAEAHAHGIVHRDIKPQNVMLSRQLQARVLDFGLAKPIGEALSEFETAPRLTATGAIAGTVPYMSPEQLRGEAVDSRSDIFSFGTMLHEMVTGGHPFLAPTAAETSAAILGRDPVVQDGMATPEVRRIIRKCLEKDRERRYQSTRDLVVDLERAGREVTAPRVPPGHPRGRVAAWLASAAALLMVGAWLAWRFGAAGTPAPAAVVPLTDFPDSASSPVLSPDGRMVAFFRGGGYFLEPVDLYVKSLPNGEPVRLTNDERLKYGPAFSADGLRVAYTILEPGTGFSTWTVPVTGSAPPTRLLPNAAGLSWLDQDHVLFSEIQGGGVHMGVVTSTESRAGKRPIYFPEHDRAMVHYSYPSPDRRSLLLVEMMARGNFGPCRVVPFDGSAAGHTVGPPGECEMAAWSPDGRWMYFSAVVGGASHLWRQRVPDGTPELLSIGAGTEEEGVAIAPDGRSLVTAIGRGQSSIWIHDAHGDRLLSSEGSAASPRLSRDGTRLYFLLRRSADRPVELSVEDIASGKVERLVPEHEVTDFELSPDETTVAFATPSRDGGHDLWVAALDRHSAPQLVTPNADFPTFAANGDLVFRAIEAHASYLERMAPSGANRRRILATPIIGGHRMSVDGRWRVVTIPGAEGPDNVAVPVDGGKARVLCRKCTFQWSIQWSADGRWLYASTNGPTVAIPLRPGEMFPATDDGLFPPPASWPKIPGARSLGQSDIAPGSSPDVFAFTKSTDLTNLFRVPIG